MVLTAMLAERNRAAMTGQKAVLMSDVNNPYCSPQNERDDRESHAIFDSGAVSEKLNWTGYDLVLLRFLPHVSVLLTLFYMALAYEYPLLWAYGTAVAFAMGTGLAMTKLVFRFERPALVWGLAPWFGAGWILFFWVIYRIAG
jgi:hypothetical protein